MKKFKLIGCLYTFLTVPTLAQSADYALGYSYLQQLAGTGHKSIGARYAGSKKEQQTAQWIETIWQQQGYKVVTQNFAFQQEDKRLKSQNLIAELPGSGEDVLVIGAHYDSTGRQSHGATDNGAGLAAMMALSQLLKETEQRAFSIRFIAFGAEEVGKKGSLHYVESLSEQEVRSIQGMINLDTVAGGDFLYIHSAHSTPYKCTQNESYRHQTELRDALLTLASKMAKGQFNLHPGYANYGPGEAGDWSDHMPFACAGIAVAQIEATNFKINGADGFDGYSQTVHPNLWDCFDKAQMTACDREQERQWGKIWHTQYDQLALLNEFFPGRVERQMQQVLTLLHAYIERGQPGTSVD